MPPSQRGRSHARLTDEEEQRRDRWEQAQIAAGKRLPYTVPAGAPAAGGGKGGGKGKKAKQCNNWRDTGACKFGDGCNFGHFK